MNLITYELLWTSWHINFINQICQCCGGRWFAPMFLLLVQENGSTLIVNFSINLVTVSDALRYILMLCEKSKWMKWLYSRTGARKSLVLSNTLNILCIQTARDFDFTCLLPAVFGLVIKDVYSCWMISWSICNDKNAFLISKVGSKQ